MDILFSLSSYLHSSPTLIYSDLQALAPEQYMKQVEATWSSGHLVTWTPGYQVTRRLIDIRLVDRPEDRSTFIELLEFAYRLGIGSVRSPPVPRGRCRGWWAPPSSTPPTW